jgi:ankyrin repeat protein
LCKFLGLDGDTALLLAVRHSRDATVRTILDHGGDPTEHNNRGDTALHHAVTINNANILRMLLETGRCEVRPLFSLFLITYPNY